MLIMGAQAAIRDTEIKVIATKTLADIPEYVASAETYRDIYANEKSWALVQYTAQLCGAVLIALRHALDYLTESTISKL